MSKIEAGLVQLNCQQFDIRQLIASLNCSLAPLFAKKKLDFSIYVEDASPQIMADHDKVSHILRNLISNAIKFTPEGGKVSVQAFARKNGA